MHNSQCPKHQPFVSGTVDRFQICAILKRHNSLFVSIIPFAHGFPFPAFPALRNPWVFASSWFRGLIWNLSCFFVNSTNFKARSIFSFLNLSYVKEWSGKYSPFLELLRRLMSKRHILSYQVLVAQILKNGTTQSNEMSRTWHKWTETSHFTQSKVTIFRTQSNEFSRSSERSRCTRWPFRELSTMTHCGHASTNRPFYSSVLSALAFE